MRNLVLSGVILLSATTSVAQPGRVERAIDRADAARSQNQARDDLRDLVRFEKTLAAFEDAWRRGDANGIRGSLRSFLQQGRAEVAEQRRETVQASNEAARSGFEARRDGTRRDARDARDDRRDAMKERAELIEETNLLGELERTAAAEWAVGPQTQVLLRARQIMQRFVQLARVELQRSRQEVREDRRELREDRRGR